VTFDPTYIETLPIEQFRRFGIACCYRLGCDRKDRRLAKALKKLEQSLGPPANEKLLRDAYNAANSVYLDLRASGDVNWAAACTLVCACWDYPIPNLIGNFETALEEGEGLSRDEVREIEREILRVVLEELPAAERRSVRRHSKRDLTVLTRAPYEKLRPGLATPDAELCACPKLSSLMLQPHLTANPISCATCGLEVPPERAGLSAELADQLGHWRSFHDAFYTLWLDSGEFESWAREQLEDLDSPVNARGIEVAQKINRLRRCYYWLFQDTGADGFTPLASCPRCNRELSALGRWQACEGCAIIVPN
jgi:hypothetical protein